MDLQELKVDESRWFTTSKRPNRPNQLSLEELRVLPTGTRIVLHHDHMSLRYAAEFVSMGEKKFSFRPDFLKFFLDETHFQDWGLIPYSGGEWNGTNWISLEEPEADIPTVVNGITCECPHEDCGATFTHYGKENETTCCPECGRQQKLHRRK